MSALGNGADPVAFLRQGVDAWHLPTVMARVVESMTKRAGCPGITLHGLRHFHASTLLQSGIDPAVVAERLGESSAAITLSVYAHCLSGWQRGAAEAFSKLMRAA